MSRPFTFAAAALLSTAAGIAVAGVDLRLAALVLGAGVAAVLLRSVGVTLALYLLVPPFLKGLLQPYAPIDLTLALAIVCVGHVAYGLVTKPSAVRLSGLALWLGLVVFMFAGLLYAPDPALASSRAIGWVTLVAAPLLAAFWVASDERELRRFVWTSLAVALTLVGLAMLAFSPSGRLTLGFTTTISIGRAALMVPFIAFLFVLREGSAWMRWPLMVVLPATVVVTIAAGARGPLLMFVVVVAALVAWHVVHARRVPQRTLVAVAAGGLLVAGVIATQPLPAAALDRFNLLGSDVAGATSADGSALARLAAANLALTIFQTHPALGAGTGAFAHYSQLVPLISDIENPHNILLEIGADWGIAGLALFAGIVLTAMYRKPPTAAWTAVLGVFLFLLANTMLGSLVDDRPFWGFTLLLLAAPQVPRMAQPSVRSAAVPGEHIPLGPPVRSMAPE